MIQVKLPYIAREDASSVKRNGGRVFAVFPDGPEIDGICANCNDSGQVGIQMFVGGPFVDPTAKRSVTEIDSKWYQVKTRFYTCPECNGGMGAA